MDEEPKSPAEMKEIRLNRKLAQDAEGIKAMADIAAADIANPLANSGTNGLEFINGDITLYIARLPVDEWIGFEVAQNPVQIPA